MDIHPQGKKLNNINNQNLGNASCSLHCPLPLRCRVMFVIKPILFLS